MDLVQIVCLIVAAVLFGLAAFGVVASRVNLMAAGLLALTLGWLLPAVLN